MAIGDEILYRRLCKPITIPTTGSGPYTYIRPVVTRNGSFAPQPSVSTCSRGSAHVHLNREHTRNILGRCSTQGCRVILL